MKKSETLWTLDENATYDAPIRLKSAQPGIKT